MPTFNSTNPSCIFGSNRYTRSSSCNEPPPYNGGHSSSNIPSTGHQQSNQSGDMMHMYNMFSKYPPPPSTLNCPSSYSNCSSPSNSTYCNGQNNSSNAVVSSDYLPQSNNPYSPSASTSSSLSHSMANISSRASQSLLRFPPPPPHSYIDPHPYGNNQSQLSLPTPVSMSAVTTPHTQPMDLTYVKELNKLIASNLLSNHNLLNYFIYSSALDLFSRYTNI